MRVLKSAGCGVVLVLCAAVGAGAGPVSRHDSPGAPSHTPVLKSISVEPGAVILTGPLSRQHLLITGRYSDGAEADITSKATVAAVGKGVVRIEGGTNVVPIGSGAAALTVRVAGQA